MGGAQKSINTCLASAGDFVSVYMCAYADLWSYTCELYNIQKANKTHHDETQKPNI